MMCIMETKSTTVYAGVRLPNWRVIPARSLGVVGANPYLSYDGGVTELYTSSGGVIRIDTASHKDVSSDYCYAYMKGNTWVAVIKKGDDILNLAQVILGVPQFLDVAFKNGNTLDLRKENMVVY